MKQIILEYTGKSSPKEIIASSKEFELIEKRKAGNPSILDKKGWENLLIFGDNLVAMRLLLKDPSIFQKVSLVYIDPPFSTNSFFSSGKHRTATVSNSKSDKIAYEDKLLGAEFLEFLRKCLILLREFMSRKSSIYVHIDWKMGHYLKVLMDEIFGRENFRNDITRIKSNPKNFRRNAYGNIKDMVLFYTKSSKYIWNDSREQLTEEDIIRLFPKINKDGRRYTTNPLHAPGETKNGPTGQAWKGLGPPKGRHWRVPPSKLSELERLGLIEWSLNGNPRKKIYANEIISKGKKRQDIWEFKDPPYPKYPTQKNLDMLKMIIKTSSNLGDIVLDCFAGSGTALVAAEQLNRKWIGIDNSKVALKVAEKRLLSECENCSNFRILEVKRSGK